MLSLIKEVSDYDLEGELWSGALSRLETITRNDKLQATR